MIFRLDRCQGFLPKIKLDKQSVPFRSTGRFLSGNNSKCRIHVGERNATVTLEKREATPESSGTHSENRRPHIVTFRGKKYVTLQERSLLDNSE